MDRQPDRTTQPDDITQPDRITQPDNNTALIFISIASYRDIQLVPTIDDCLRKAAHPERLRFGICWQHGAEQADLPFHDDPRFQILDIDWRDSRGACWARAAIMALYQAEDWFLQIDSHSRFCAGWDSMIIHVAQSTGSPLPILSTYPPPFTPSDNELLAGEPLQMAFQGFTPEGIPYMKPMAIPDWRARPTPMRARFLAAGFLFAPGSFVRDVPYDPELYFIGEEATMTLRAFTAGYDLFHPCALLIWHDYVRAYATRHWDDHTTANQAPRDWGELDLHSKAKVRRILAGQPVESHGLGTVRTAQAYETYAGLSFSHRKGQNYTLLAEEPPNPPASPDWPDQIYTWMVRIILNAADLPAGSLDDPAFWFVAVHDEQHHEIFRRDFTRTELESLTGQEPRITLLCEFQAGIIPASWTVWPVTRAGGWLQQVKGPLAENDFSIILEDEAEPAEMSAISTDGEAAPERPL